MPSWTILTQRNSWNTLEDKPAILSDNQIAWNEINDVPIDIRNFLAKAITPKTKFHDYLLGVYQSSSAIEYKWHAINRDVSSYSVASRDNLGILKANNFVALNIPTDATGLSAGSLYKDANGFVKIV